MTDRIEIIARTERRGKYSDAEKAAILAEADLEGVTVREVAAAPDCRELDLQLAFGTPASRGPFQ